jgi:ATP-dependent Clp protease protease subunit
MRGLSIDRPPRRSRGYRSGMSESRSPVFGPSAHRLGNDPDDQLPSAGGPDNTAWLDEQLFARRIVFLRGPLDSSTANRAAAALIGLDALSDQPVQLHMNAVGGDFPAVFALIDAVEAMHAPVRAIAIGEVGGAVVGAFAAVAARSAYPHARFRLAEPKVTSPGGTANQVVAEAGRYLRDLEELVLRVASATGQPRHRIEDDFAAGRVLSAEEAREYGLIAEIVTPPAR